MNADKIHYFNAIDFQTHDYSKDINDCREEIDTIIKNIELLTEYFKDEEIKKQMDEFFNNIKEQSEAAINSFNHPTTIINGRNKDKSIILNDNSTNKGGIFFRFHFYLLFRTTQEVMVILREMERDDLLNHYYNELKNALNEIATKVKNHKL
jgi:predicted RND superfamily exporter protein